MRISKSENSKPEVFTIEEVDQLVAVAPDLDWQTLILLGFYLGASLSDCVAMTWDNVDAAKGWVRYPKKKTGKMVVVPMHPRLSAHLHQVSATIAAGPLCPTLFGRTSGGTHGLSEGFKRVVKRAGLDVMGAKGKGAPSRARRTFQSLRYSFSSALAKAGVSEEIRMKLTGHRSADRTMKDYLR